MRLFSLITLNTNKIYTQHLLPILAERLKVGLSLRLSITSLTLVLRYILPVVDICAGLPDLIHTTQKVG